MMKGETEQLILSKETVFSGGVEGGGLDLYRRTGTQDFYVIIDAMYFDENDDEIWKRSEINFNSWNEAWDYLQKNNFYSMHPLEIHPDYYVIFEDYLRVNRGMIIKSMPNWEKYTFPKWLRLFRKSDEC